MFLSYTYTQPYYYYVEQLLYNVIPGTVTLTFDSTPSSDPADYQMVASQGILMFTEMFGFNILPPKPTITFSGNTVTLTMPINMDTGVVMQIFYQGSKLPFHIVCTEDFSYETPSIWVGKPFALP